MTFHDHKKFSFLLFCKWPKRFYNPIKNSLFKVFPKSTPNKLLGNKKRKKINNIASSIISFPDILINIFFLYGNRKKKKEK